MAVAAQQCGGCHPTVWRSPSNCVAVAIQLCGGCHTTTCQWARKRLKQTKNWQVKFHNPTTCGTCIVDFREKAFSLFFFYALLISSAVQDWGLLAPWLIGVFKYRLFRLYLSTDCTSMLNLPIPEHQVKAL